MSQCAIASAFILLHSKVRTLNEIDIDIFSILFRCSHKMVFMKHTGEKVRIEYGEDGGGTR